MSFNNQMHPPDPSMIRRVHDQLKARLKRSEKDQDKPKAAVAKPPRAIVRDVNHDFDEDHEELDEDAFAIAKAHHAGDYWRCSACTVENETLLLECSVCQAPRPREKGGKAQEKYICDSCTYDNADIYATQCEMCGSKRNMNKKDADVKPSDGVESKDNEENRFVLGSGAPPPLKRKMMIREHRAFLAGIEESFGTIHVHPALIAGIENLIRAPFDSLTKQYDQPLGSSLPTGVTHDILNQLLKALVYHAAKRALRVYSTVTTILSCGAEEDRMLALSHCNICKASGRDLILHYSETCSSVAPSSSKARGGRQQHHNELHTFCLQDTREYIMKLIQAKQCSRVVCPYVDANGTRCDMEVDTKFIRRCLSTSEFKLYLDECFSQLIAGNQPASGDMRSLDGDGSGASFIQCPNVAGKCASIMEVQAPHGLVIPDYIKEVDENGTQLSPQAWLHFTSYRIRCHQCHVNFCSSCKSIPYHLGRSCEEQKQYLASKHCRYCADQLSMENSDWMKQQAEQAKAISAPGGVEIAAPGASAVGAASPAGVAAIPPAFEYICTSVDCTAKKAIACPEMLACNHPCPGIKGEPSHPPCLHPDCAAKNPQLKVTQEDLCNICWVDELGSAPVIQLASCNHIFHAQCVSDKISKRWPGVRITFGFLDCSLCKVPMQHPSPMIQSLRSPVDALYKAIAEKALARLSIEKMEQDAKLIDPNSRYYNQPLKYAMDCFAYYNCFKCRSEYFGGRRDCEQNAAAENRPPEEFVCFKCADLKFVKCKKDGHSEYQVWKCRFCCNIASWFCFGTTHFCEPCHSNDPMERTRRARSGFKQCAGYQMCPCKVAHSPNGAEADCEFNLGCGACQEELCQLQAAAKKEELVEAKLLKDKQVSHSSVQL